MGYKPNPRLEEFSPRLLFLRCNSVLLGRCFRFQVGNRLLCCCLKLIFSYSPAFSIQHPFHQFTTLILSMFLALQFFWTYQIGKSKTETALKYSGRFRQDCCACFILAILSLALFVVGLVKRKTWTLLNLVRYFSWNFITLADQDDCFTKTLCVILGVYSLRCHRIFLRTPASISTEGPQASCRPLQPGERDGSELGDAIGDVHSSHSEGNSKAQDECTLDNWV
jgi:hypothetical protein